MKYMTVANKDTLPSREVAKMVDMRHTDLLRNIENYIAVISENAKLRSQDYFIPNTYKVEGNNKTYPCYDITKLGCEMIANKLTGKKGILFTAEYVKRFNEMEQGQHQAPALPDFTNPAVAARAWAEQFEKRELVEKENLALTAQIETMKPKADYTDKILQSNKTVPITLIAKDYGMSAQAMNKVLHDSHIIWKCSGQWVLYAEYQGTGYTHSKTEPNRNKNGEEVGGVHTQLEWTQKGRLFLYTFLKEKRNLLPLIERNEFETFLSE